MRKKKYLFVYPDFEYRVDTNKNKTRIYEKGGWYNEGIAQLAAVVEEEGWEVDMIHLLRPVSQKEFLAEIERIKPDVVGMNVRTDVFPYCEKVAKWLDGKGIHVMAGSYHPSIYPDQVIKWRGLNSLVIGEAELPLKEFLKRYPDLGDQKISSFWFKNEDEKIVKNKPCAIAENLDELPFPKFNLFNFQNLLSSKSKSALAIITRGCPYRCTYCWNNFHASLYPKGSKFVRYRSAANAIEYLKRLIKAFPEVQRLKFLDDILPMYTEWRKEFRTKYIKEIHIPFFCNFRANFLTEDVAKMLKEMGCLFIFFGVESGNQKILNDILKRGMTLDIMRDAFKNCRKYGIKTISYNIIGIPHEKPENLIETLKFNAEIKPTQAIPMIFCPYPGTELTDMAVAAGYYDPNKSRNQYVSCVMNDFPPNHVLFAATFFREFFRAYQIAFSLPKPLSMLTEAIIDRIFLSNLVPRKLLSQSKIKFVSLRNKLAFFIKRNFKFLYIFITQKVLSR